MTGYFLVDWNTLDRSTSSSLTAALFAASISALRGGLVGRLLEGVGELEAEGGERLGIGLLLSVPASVPYTRAERLT